MAGKRKGRVPVADKRAAYFAQRAAGRDARGYLAVMCDYVEAAADGHTEARIKTAADEIRRIAEGLSR